MALDWVQEALKERLGYAPFPATLNLRPEASEDARFWDELRKESEGISLPTADGHCSARLYRVDIYIGGSRPDDKVEGAVLVPDVSGYPKDKIEIVAPVRLKDTHGVQDGDSVTLEFVN